MSSRTHILIVEDEKHLADGIKYNLEAEGYRTTVIRDGAEALRFVEQRSHEVDLVILDLMLPGVSGYAVCESIRERGGNMPILMLSARTLSEDRTRGFTAGADQYMTKPFDLDEFLSRIKSLLSLHGRRSGGATSPPLEGATCFEFGDARIDFEKFEVIVGSQRVKMTPLELRLLRYFIANEGRVIPRSELLANVWERSPNALSRAPDQFIRRLRKTFEKDPSRPRHFLTVRDAGYRFLSEGAGDERPAG